MAAFPQLVVVGYLAAKVRGRLALAKADERGYSTEGVILTVVLVLMAIASVVIINAQILVKPGIIPTE
ncbi:MAG TPA: hypothetical protein VGR26_19250 [Acidimicrobiales bacterium]|nr:hypothetical protein [Acidimicrobiales bacterium]